MKQREILQNYNLVKRFEKIYPNLQFDAGDEHNLYFTECDHFNGSLKLPIWFIKQTLELLENK